MPSLTLICGPSGAGKTTLERLLQDQGMRRLCSTTTRPPRPGEENGVHYNFVERDEFEAGLHSQAFIESTHYNGNYYGLTHADVESSLNGGRPVVAVLDINGVLPLFDLYANVHGVTVQGVFLDADRDELIRRMDNRADMSPELMQQRMALIDRDKGWKKHFIPTSQTPENIRLWSAQNITMEEMLLLSQTLVRDAIARGAENRHDALSALHEKQHAHEMKVAQATHRRQGMSIM